jgi:DNA modification methylase
MNVEIKKVKLTEIKLNPDNPRTISKRDMERLVKSLADAPWMLDIREIVVDETMTVLGGNMRLQALKKAGARECMAKIVTGLTSEQKREFVVKDNGSMGEWSYDDLANSWSDLPLADWGVDLPEDWLGGDESEPADAEPQIDKAEELNKVWGVKLGDLWQIGEHRLLCGDSTKKEDVGRVMGGEKADMVFTDPPYALFGNSTGVAGVCDDKMVRPFFLAVFSAIRENVKQFGHAYTCCDWHSAFSLQAMAAEAHLTAKNLIVWDKGEGGMGAMYQHCYEFIWFHANSPIAMSTVGKKKTGERTVNGKSNIWRFNRVGEGRQHNAAKPVEMVAHAIDNSSDSGETVADLFGGSGSTMVASENTKRKCRMIEISPSYCAVILQRMTDAFPGIEIKRL